MNYLFLVLIALIAFQRLLEVKKSNEHTTKLLKSGAKEFAPEHYKWMVLLHGTWLVAILYEHLNFHIQIPAYLLIVTSGFLIIGQALRIIAQETLKGRWTTRIIALKVKPVEKGVYKYIHHPNYWGVVFELAAVPLLGGCWRTALIFTVANLLLLKVRIREENRSLQWARNSSHNMTLSTTQP